MVLCPLYRSLLSLWHFLSAPLYSLYPSASSMALCPLYGPLYLYGPLPPLALYSILPTSSMALCSLYGPLSPLQVMFF
jgi:hypothetical protein